MTVSERIGSRRLATARDGSPYDAAMLGSAAFVGFIPIREVETAKGFYSSTLGLEITEDSPFALVVDANGTMLRLTPVPDFEPQTFTIAGWSVSDIAATVAALSAKGVVFKHFDGMEQDTAGIWRAPGGSFVAWFADPDGNTLSLTEFLENEVD